MDNIEAANLVDNIRETIAERGWTKNDFVDETGAVCLLGAGRLCQGADHEKLRYHKFIDEDTLTGQALGLFNDQTGLNDVPHFNDYKLKSIEELDAFLVNRSKSLRELG